MELNEETYSLFDRCLLGNLSSDEKIAFEKELAANQTVHEEFLWVSDAVNEIRMAGKTILKTQLAEIGAAIPASAFEKYSPGIKSNSFFRKWWWVIMTIAAALALTALWFVLHRQTKKEIVPKEKPAAKTSSYTVPVKDSIKKTVSPLEKSSIDSVGINSNCNTLFGDDNCHSFVVTISSPDKNSTVEIFPWTEKEKAAPLADTARNLQNIYYYLDQPVTSSSINITVECCPQNKTPAYYIYSDHLTLASNYADTSGLRFYQNGNILVMTDDKPGYFLLSKSEKEQPLVKVNADLQEEVKKVIDQPKPKKNVRANSN